MSLYQLTGVSCVSAGVSCVSDLGHTGHPFLWSLSGVVSLYQLAGVSCVSDLGHTGHPFLWSLPGVVSFYQLAGVSCVSDLGHTGHPFLWSLPVLWLSTSWQVVTGVTGLSGHLVL